MAGPLNADLKASYVCTADHDSVGTQRFLAEKTRHFLKPGEHVELTRSEHKLSIIAPRSTAEVVLDEIIKLLRDTKTVVIPIDKICPETAKGKIAKKDLDAVGQVTNTLTRVDIRRSNVRRAITGFLQFI